VPTFFLQRHRAEVCRNARDNKEVEIEELDRKKLQEISKECADFYEIDAIPLPKITFLYSREEVDKAFGRKTEDWVMAAKLRDGLYFVHPSKIERVTSHREEEFWPAVKHELSHAYYDKITGVCTPRWFNEGIANVVAGVKVPKPAPIDKQVTEFYFSYSDIEALRWGYGMVNFLYKEYGHDKLIQFVKSLTTAPMSKDFFAERFQATYCFELAELQEKVKTE
jgi:hypothetical protein